MKSLIYPLFVFLLFVVLAKQNIYAEDIKNYSLTIEGMTCSSCKRAIEKSVQKMPGIIEIKVNHQTGKGIVRFDAKKTNLEKIKKTIEGLGYKVLKYEEI
ncbi:MAG: heavy-metal-associated domain-containing protein [Leptonema sp. (in: bacteria)]|jgi:Cu+-exporting ATPase